MKVGLLRREEIVAWTGEVRCSMWIVKVRYSKWVVSVEC